MIFAAKPDDADKSSVFQTFPAVCSGESMIQDWLSLHLSRLLPILFSQIASSPLYMKKNND